MDNRAALELAELADKHGQFPCMNAPDLFFPSVKDKVHSNEALNIAKQLCQGCPIRLQCAQYALENFEVYGVWGGLGPQDRKKLWRKAGIDYAEYADE